MRGPGAGAGIGVVLPTGVVVALFAGACGFNAEVEKAAGELTGAPAPPPAEAVEEDTVESACVPHDVLPAGGIRFPDGSISQPDGSISFPDGSTIVFGRVSWGETLEEVAAQLDLVVLVRATDNAWPQSPPGHASRLERPDDEEYVADGMSYRWREFEVVEVLSGSYDHGTLNYGNMLDRTCPGETYLLLISVLTASSGDQDPVDWPPQHSDQHFTGPAPPYLLMAGDILQSTDANAYPELDETLTLPDARARLAD